MLKLDEIDFGTKLRTILVVASSLNTALMATDLTGFQNPTVDLIYKVASLILNFIIVAITAFFNNDFTSAGQIGTYATRALKADPTVVVDIFDADEDDDDEDEETPMEGEDNEVE